MVPGLSSVVEYQLAAERLHDTPFMVATLASTKLEDRVTVLKVYVNRILHTYKGGSYQEVHDKAVRAFMVYNRLDRIRGLA